MRRWLAFLTVTVLFLPSHALASTLVVTESGTFDPATPVTAYSTPGGSFFYSFNIASTPVTSLVSVGNYFNAAFTNFTYTLNGVAGTPTVGSITFFSTAYVGLFDICFVSACDGNITPDLGFELAGNQAYLGSENNPTLVPGSYLPSDAGFYASGNFLELASAGPVVFAPAGATPEPSSIALLGSGLLAIGGLFRRRRWEP